MALYTEAPYTIPLKLNKKFERTLLVTAESNPGEILEQTIKISKKEQIPNIRQQSDPRSEDYYTKVSLIMCLKYVTSAED